MSWLALLVGALIFGLVCYRAAISSDGVERYGLGWMGFVAAFTTAYLLLQYVPMVRK